MLEAPDPRYSNPVGAVSLWPIRSKAKSDVLRTSRTRSSCSGMDAKTSNEIIPCSLKRADGRLRAATTQRTSEADLPSRRELASQYTRARSADERDGVLHRFSSIACCVGIAVALSCLPQVHGEQQQQAAASSGSALSEGFANGARTSGWVYSGGARPHGMSH